MPDELDGVTDGTEDYECANCGAVLIGLPVIGPSGDLYCCERCAEQDDCRPTDDDVDADDRPQQNSK